MIPPPNLDDRDFEQLRTEALGVVRARGGSWDDLGPSDPGIVLLEAFAYLTDLLLYRLNRVPEKARREFLGLLGVAPAAPSAAGTVMRFSRTAELAATAATVPAGIAVRAKDGGGGTPVVFITDAPLQLAEGVTDGEVSAHHCEQVDGELLGISTGEPGQQFRLAAPPVVLPTGHELDLLIGVEATTAELENRPTARTIGGKAYALWDVVPSFAGLADGATAVRVDRTSGLVSFAPSVRRPHPDGGVAAEASALAAVPPAGRGIMACYRRGGGSRGNVAADSLTVIDPGPAAQLQVTNPARATGGRDGEALEEALRRAPQLFHEPRRAVTADDFEALARSEGGVARARATTEAEAWVHAQPGSVELRLVPSIAGTTDPPDAEMLRGVQSAATLDRVRTLIRSRQPLGIQSVVRYIDVKEVAVQVRVVVARSEDPAALRGRVEDRLRRALSPTPVPGNPTGWPFGQALRASNVYDIALREPGVRYADGVAMEVAQTPDGAVSALAADHFQPRTWYTAQGSVLFRSENDGVGWEAIHGFDDGEIVCIVASRDLPGAVAAIVAGTDGRSSRVFTSADCGSSWSTAARVGFSWQAEEAPQTIRDVSWLPPEDSDDLLVATDRGLYRLQFGDAAPKPWVIDPNTPEVGCWSVVATTTGDGGLEVAVALQSRRGIWLAGPGPEDAFRPQGLANVDIRRLLLERRGLRRFLWAPTFAVGNDAGTGCQRTELRGTAALDLAWVDLGLGWNGGICHDLAFLGEQVLGASQFNGVLVRDGADPAQPWHPPSVESSGLPLQEDRRFHPVVALSARGGVALIGTGRGVFTTSDGQRFRAAARRVVSDEVTLPASWLFTSGQHHVDVVTEDG